MTLWAIGIQTTSIPLKRSLLMIVLGHRYHQSKEYWNQHSVFLHKLMWTPILHNNKKFQYLQHQRARMLDRQYPSHLFRRPLCQLKVSDYWGSKKKEAELITIIIWPQPTELRSWKISFQAKSQFKSLFLCKIPEPLCYRLMKLRILKVLTISIHLYTKKNHLGLREYCFHHCKPTLKNIQTEKFEKQVTTTKGKAQSENRSLSDRQIAWNIYVFFKSRGENEVISDFNDLWDVQRRTKMFKPSLQSWSKYYQQSLTNFLTTNSKVCTDCKLKSRRDATIAYWS